MGSGGTLGTGENRLAVGRAKGFGGPVFAGLISREEKGVASREILGAPIPADVLTAVLKDRARIALRRAGLADEDRIAAIVAKLGAHSLRSGFTTSQLEAGVDPLAVANMTGHRSLASFRIYDQRENDSNPSLKLLTRSSL